MTEISCSLKADLILILQINAYAFSINFFCLYKNVNLRGYPRKCFFLIYKGHATNNLQCFDISVLT